MRRKYSDCVKRSGFDNYFAGIRLVVEVKLVGNSDAYIRGTLRRDGDDPVNVRSKISKLSSELSMLEVHAPESFEAIRSRANLYMGLACYSIGDVVDGNKHLKTATETSRDDEKEFVDQLSYQIDRHHPTSKKNR